MHLLISKPDLARVITSVAKVVETRNTVPILSNIRLTAADDELTVTATDLDIVATASVPADITDPGALCVDAKLLSDIARKSGGDITMSLDGDLLVVKSGRSIFKIATLPVSDFPSIDGGRYDATFDIDLAALFAPVAFAMSTEETRYYLNGLFFKGALDHYTAVATDGHRLSRHVVAGGAPFDGVIVPRKTVGLLPKGIVTVSVSDAKIRIQSEEIVLVSKLIDGTFPDYERVIPACNDKIVTVDRDAIMRAVDRVSTVSPERGRAARFSITSEGIGVSVVSDAGTASDEIEAAFDGEPFNIGFNSRYLREVFATLPAGDVTLALADGGPGLVTGGAAGLTMVVMPMRV